jgi:RimJ/RimL family protein N-acetyltransferase
VNAARRNRKTLLPDPARSELIRLGDGRDVVIRPIDPADAAPISESFQLLTDDEVRRRFLHPLKALSEEHLRKLTHPTESDEFVVVAAEPLPPGDALVGAVARLSRDSHDSSRAEFAILVSRFLGGQGLGRILMQRLIDWSQRHGVREVWGDVMEDNTAMLELAHRLGFHRENMFGAPGLIRVSRHFP